MFLYLRFETLASELQSDRNQQNIVVLKWWEQGAGGRKPGEVCFGAKRKKGRQEQDTKRVCKRQRGESKDEDARRGDGGKWV